MTTYLQPQEIALVTPIRNRVFSQMEAFEAVKKLPYVMQQKGYGGQINFKLYFAEFVKLVEGGQYM